MRRACGVTFLLILITCGCGRSVVTNPCEGMWLPNALPVDRLKRQFDFSPTPQWAENLRLASTHLGASGAFVSPDGLVLTNHHVAGGGLQDISRPGRDYIADGFLARTRDQEIRLPGVDLNVLVSIEDVTGQVNSAVDAKLPPDQSVKARRAVFADLERRSLEQTGLQSHVVTLYGGAMFHLYHYKRYNDIRVVFAPEASSAFFGGDPDNFEYPRFCLDIALLRAYENGRPAHVEHYLPLSADGVKENELVFISGHPHRTDRLLPASMLRAMRDWTLPLRVEALEREEKAVLEYSARSDEARRQAQEEIFYVQNSLKASRPRLAALQSGIIELKEKQEQSIRNRLRQRDDLQRYDAAWDRIAQAEQHRGQLYLRRYLLEEARAFRSDLFHSARQLVRLAAEDAKPDAQRLPEYTLSKRQALEEDLFADTPSYPALETAKLTASLKLLRDKLGADDPIVRKVLEGKTPAERAAELVKGTHLDDAKERRRIRAGGAAAIASSDDSMICLAKLVDDDARAVRTATENQVDEPETQARADINKARFALDGANDYPDATDTLRFGFGLVKGYQQDGQSIPAWTTIEGAFEHEKEHSAAPPFALPKSWRLAKDQRNGPTPLNFVSTADITGGNSGSPVVNRSGELVGVIFDSNRQGVPSDFAYTDVQARSVAVDSRAILEALRKVYHADELVAELTAAAGRK